MTMPSVQTALGELLVGYWTCLMEAGFLARQGVSSTVGTSAVAAAYADVSGGAGAFLEDQAPRVVAALANATDLSAQVSDYIEELGVLAAAPAGALNTVLGVMENLFSITTQYATDLQGEAAALERFAEVTTGPAADDLAQAVHSYVTTAVGEETVQTQVIAEDKSKVDDNNKAIVSLFKGLESLVGKTDALSKSIGTLIEDGLPVETEAAALSIGMLLVNIVAEVAAIVDVVVDIEKIKALEAENKKLATTIQSQTQALKTEEANVAAFTILKNDTATFAADIQALSQAFQTVSQDLTVAAASCSSQAKALSAGTSSSAASSETTALITLATHYAESLRTVLLQSGIVSLLSVAPPEPSPEP